MQGHGGVPGRCVGTRVGVCQAVPEYGGSPGLCWSLHVCSGLLCEGVLGVQGYSTGSQVPRSEGSC